MASAHNTISSTISFCRPISSSSLSTPTRLPVQSFPFRKCPSLSSSSSAACKSGRFFRAAKLRSSFAVAAAAELGETLAPEAEAPPAAVQDQTVSVTVSPSDILTMLFQAEGSISDVAVPNVTKALEETEGVSDMRIEVTEGIATVHLTKQTTVQATGVASSLVELIQSKGFKLQTLNLSFQDEEDLS